MIRRKKQVLYGKFCSVSPEFFVYMHKWDCATEAVVMNISLVKVAAIKVCNNSYNLCVAVFFEAAELYDKILHFVQFHIK